MNEQGYLDGLDADVGSDFLWPIDEILNFSSDEVGAGEVGGFEGCWATNSDVLSFSGESSAVHAAGSTNQSQSLEDDLPPALSVPCEDIAELEWLSNFVEDSFSAASIDIEKDSTTTYGGAIAGGTVTTINFKEEPESQFRSSSPVSVLESSSFSGKPALLSPGPVPAVPSRVRSKRPRPSSFSPRSIPLVSPATSASDENLPPPPKKITKKKKKLHASEAPIAEGAAPPLTIEGVRKCVHCGIQKTPQWRMGPTGPKTLCNACGVRYKSGRLYPEYRPAASPTFIATLHSNSHKKVLEMRIKSGQNTPAPTPLFVRKNNHLLNCT